MTYSPSYKATPPHSQRYLKSIQAACNSLDFSMTDTPDSHLSKKLFTASHNFTWL